MNVPPTPSLEVPGIGRGWLHEVPAHWKQVAAKWVFAQVRHASRPDDVQLAATQKYGVVPQQQYMELEGHQVQQALSGTGSFQHVEPGDFVISLSSYQGGIELSRERGCVSPAYTVLRNVGQMDTEYARYLLKAQPFVLALDATSHGIRKGKTTTYDAFGRIRLPIPPLDEQRRIAAFLDYETAHIDKLLREAEQLITLLEEKAARTVGAAVRHGIDRANLVDSGDILVRSMPEHWKLAPLRSSIRHVPIRPVGASWASRQLLSLTRRGVVERDIDSGVGKYPSDFSSYQVVEPGDLVFCLFDMDETPRTVGLSSSSGMITSAYSVFRPLETTDGRFVDYYFQDVDAHKSLRPFYSGLRKTIRPAAFLRIRSAFPNLREQVRIAEYLDEVTSHLAQLKADATMGTRFLSERRSALIANAVTGQLDASSWTPPDDWLSSEAA